MEREIKIGDSVKWKLPNNAYKSGDVIAIVRGQESMFKKMPPEAKKDIVTDVSKFDRALIHVKEGKKRYYSPKLNLLELVNRTVFDEITQNHKSLYKALMDESESGNGCPPKMDWTCDEIDGECEICWSRYLCMPAD